MTQPAISRDPSPNSGQVLGRRIRDPRDDALQRGPRKKPMANDPLVHYGRHFGRVIYAFCNVKTLLTNGLERLAGDGDDVGDLTTSQRREESIFQDLIRLCPGFQEKLVNASIEEVGIMADLIQKGMNGSRADDTKGMKAAIVDWITPKGQTLTPPLNRKIKSDRGFHHERTGALLCPAGMDWALPQVKQQLRSGEVHVRGDQWPIFLYAGLTYHRDDPWNGLLRGQLLVTAFKHVFTSPSSADDDQPKATKSGNARIHGMTVVTKASLAYIATQVRFALCSASTFSRTDTVTDSETFYTSLLTLLEDTEEVAEVDTLLQWWNRQIFPQTAAESQTLIEGSALARIKQKRREMRGVP